MNFSAMKNDEKGIFFKNWLQEKEHPSTYMTLETINTILSLLSIDMQQIF
jgi:hypothetical protein